MRKLDKRDLTRLGEAESAVTRATATIESIHAKYQAELEAEAESIDVALELARGVLEDIISEAQDYAESRSDKWQESDSGQAYRDWIEHFASKLALVETGVDLSIEPPQCLEGLNEACNELHLDSIQTEPGTDY